MDIDAVKSLLSQIALIFGGWTVIVTGIVVFISQITTKKLFITWDKKNQIEIEKIRHAQSESQLILKELATNLSSSQTHVQTRRIDAIDKLWNITLELRNNFSIVCLWFEITLPSEYSLIKSNPKASSDFQNVTYANVIKWVSSTIDISKYRPYLSETLWQEFFLYRAILGRLGLLIVKLKEGEKVEDWRQDDMIQSHLKALLDKSEYEEVVKTKYGSVNMALEFIESKMLLEIGNILSGRQSTIDNLKSSIEIQKLIARSNVIFEEEA